jgi:uncharacterized oligopeptide transporter (OPT) family protein
MIDKVILGVGIYLVVAFGLGVLIGKTIKWGRTRECRHDWVARGYGGAGWTLSRCRKCGETEIDPS